MKPLRVLTGLQGPLNVLRAEIEFNAGGLFPLGDAGLLHHRGVLFVNNRLIPLPDSLGLNNPNSQQAPERFVDADALAEHLSVARRQVLEMTRRGIIPGHPLGVGTNRKVWRYKISEVEAALAARARITRLGDVAGMEESARRTMPLGSSPSQRRKSNG